MKFLIAEDDDDDLLLIKDFIQEGLRDVRVQIDHVVSMDDVISKAGCGGGYDVIFLDYSLGKRNGIEILRALREKGYKPPIILLTGRGDQTIAVEAMKAGATDYVAKANLSAQTLAGTIRSSIRFFKQQEKRERAENALRVQSKMLQGVSEAANRLLNVFDHHSAVQEAIHILGEASDVNRVFIFQDHSDLKNGELIFTLRFHWSEDQEFSESEVDKMGVTCSFQEAEEWRNCLADGISFHGGVAELPRPIAAVLENNGLRSVILYPILIDFVFWGFIVFGDTSEERGWTSDEEAIFRTAVASLEGEIKRQRDGRAFRSIVEGTSSRTGDEFFKSLVRNLASAFPAKYAYVCELMDYSRTRCRIVAGWDGEKIILDDQFNIVGTPSEEMIAGLVSFHSDRVQESFPNDNNLAKINAVSYAGVPFFNSAMKPIGFLAVADVKPFMDKVRTISVLRVFASRAGAELERLRGEEIIKNMAYYDSLTGLPNRVLLNDRSERVLEHAKANKTMFAVLFLDFDNFKPINDKFGHAMGDLLLKIMSDRIANNIRKPDTLARLGGDEFILLLPEINKPEEAANIARKLNGIGREYVNLGGKQAAISFSIGIAIFPADGDSIKELMKKADDALYKAKNKGGDTFHLATPLSPVQLKE